MYNGRDVGFTLASLGRDDLDGKATLRTREGERSRLQTAALRGRNSCYGRPRARAQLGGDPSPPPSRCDHLVRFLILKSSRDFRDNLFFRVWH